MWTLFVDCCDFYDNHFVLYNMLDSESVFANAHSFTASICRQLTWEILNDSHQYFFKTLSVDDFTSGQVCWLSLLLTQIVGADVHACREIRMGNFPEKWGLGSTVGSFASASMPKSALTGLYSTTSFPVGFPPAPTVFPLPPPQQLIQSGAQPSEKAVTICQTDIHSKSKTS